MLPHNNNNTSGLEPVSDGHVEPMTSSPSSAPAVPESFNFQDGERPQAGSDGNIDVEKPEVLERVDAPCLEVFPFGWWRQFGLVQKIGLVLGPLAAIIMANIEISEENPKANEALAMTLFIVIYWCCEVVPIAVTSLLPLILYPLASVSRGRTLAALYYNHISFLFLGAFVVVLAVEDAMAHKRFALWALKFCGTRPPLVLLGFMLITGVISMFASNTSTTILMVPVVKGFLEGRNSGPDGKRFEKASLLGVAFAATTGGTATIIGTVPNLVFSLLYSGTFPSAPALTFQNWLAFAFPLTFVVMIIAWLSIWFIFMRGLKLDLNPANLARERASLGPVTRDEIVLGIVLFIMVMLWIVRPYAIDPFLGYCSDDTYTREVSCEDNDGVWYGYIDDGTIAVLGAVSLYFIPSSSKSGRMLLDESAFKRLPWGVLLLMGAGFAIASSVSSSGLSLEISSLISSAASLSPAVLVLVVTVIVSLITELISNTASITLFGPILLELAVQQQINPLLLGLPATVAASFAYLLPTATPPSTIAFAACEGMTFYDMFKGGIIVKIASIALTIPFVFGTGRVFGDLSEFPEWAATSALNTN
mmetsp:Transcript_12434/g.24146  ORF Transcript_12434/g.24146 Transcript_12434/m.24146 type:complete len:591 (-) Transcript_12434:276-2048(-)|eukprot:CAMPEP_0171492116 /NCGR_PEP_ID=MMETSP0958-20121227/4235_1 /TAXON_ID=87120 /ORGANISM="Aurantiochytrium limacinum, Strain ATCCMYA-1381" /LENGTH=590 /DNA_ID=CAMNT_0012025607 /DNA_START=127 /DNA_END=1899 /DNA_ORIENTATION=-